MKAYLSRISILSVFGERQTSNSETSKAFNIRRPALAADVCAHALDFVYRIYLTRAGRNSIYERCATRELRKIPTRQSGTVYSPVVPIAVNKPGETKSDICARARKVDFIYREESK